MTTETNSLVLAPAQPAQRPVQTPTSTQAALVGMTGCPDLSKALAAARDRCKAAAKDGRVAFGNTNYAYATADQILAVASEALATSDLALIPAAQELTVLGSGNMAFYALNRTVILSHGSGQYVLLEVKGWPVLVERGRGLDKAFAAALTGSLSYLLRDTLLVRRGDDDDIAARDDTQAQAPEPPGGSDPNAQQPATPPASSLTISQEQREALVSLARQHQRTAGEVSAMLAAVNCKVLDQLPANLAGWLTTVLTDGLIALQQSTLITKLVEQRGGNWVAFENWLAKTQGVRLTAMLSQKQAQQVIDKLQAAGAPAPQPA